MNSLRPVLIPRGLPVATGTVLLLVVVGCGSTAPMSGSAEEPSVSRQYRVEDLTASDLHDVLVFEVNRWIGVEYRYGGNGRSGFDCSGFVRRVYRDALDESLPRTTREQMRMGAAVNRNRLQVGDLVFFRTPSRTDHVGVYLGDGEFAHASTSSGVMVSHLGEPYWSKSYRSARRVLDVDDGDGRPEQPVETVSSDATERDRRAEADRVGW
jgi:cell wall-associated NlpC family hydrolase